MNVTVLYTAFLDGDLDLLPRLATLMRQHAAKSGVGRVVRVDLGGACSAANWHCAASDGRSMLLALDAMGYDAANTDGYLSDAGRAGLTAMGDSLHIAPLGASAVWQVAPHRSDQRGLGVALSPGHGTHMEGGVLHLAEVRGGQLGVARCTPEAAGWGVAFTGVFHVRPDTPPDTSIAGIIDLITSEARAVQKRKDRP